MTEVIINSAIHGTLSLRMGTIPCEESYWPVVLPIACLLIDCGRSHGQMQSRLN